MYNESHLAKNPPDALALRSLPVLLAPTGSVLQALVNCYSYCKQNFSVLTDAIHDSDDLNRLYYVRREKLREQLSARDLILQYSEIVGVLRSSLEATEKPQAVVLSA